MRSGLLPSHPMAHALHQDGGTKTIHIWDASTGESYRPLTGHTDAIYCNTFSADGHYLASGQMTRQSVCGMSHRDSGTYPQLPLAILKGVVDSISFSPNSNGLVLGCGRHTLYFYSISSGSCKLEQAIYGHSDLMQAVVFAPNGLSIASCSGSTDLNHAGSIKIWIASMASTQSAGVLIDYIHVIPLTCCTSRPQHYHENLQMKEPH